MTMIEPTRAAALARLAAFAPLAGRAYAHDRNTDFGTGRHDAVSILSPYTRRRLLTEREIVETVIATHGRDGADRFIAEVFWRSYFKGWLERRPVVWQHYTETRDILIEQWRDDPRLSDAEHGRTGIAIFDEWAHELISTGYLHNHSRMWFASIWIFTLRLPWQLGADFFLRHLLDGDPASNTLSWRWVAGLHTRGKHYLATRTNIDRFTRNRPLVEPGQLDEAAPALEEDFDPGPALPPRTPIPADPTRRSVLLLTPEDCHPDSVPMPDTVATASLDIDFRSPRQTAKIVRDFDTGALADTAARLGLTTTSVSTVQALAALARSADATQIVTPYVPQGPTRDWLVSAIPVLDAEGIMLGESRREWDTLVWQHASAGFFKVKKIIPRILDTLNIDN